MEVAACERTMNRFSCEREEKLEKGRKVFDEISRFFFLMIKNTREEAYFLGFFLPRGLLLTEVLIIYGKDLFDKRRKK